MRSFILIAFLIRQVRRPASFSAFGMLEALHVDPSSTAFSVKKDRCQAAGASRAERDDLPQAARRGGVHLAAPEVGWAPDGTGELGGAMLAFLRKKFVGSYRFLRVRSRR